MLYRCIEAKGNNKIVFDLDEVKSFSADSEEISYHILEKTLENILTEIFRMNGTYMPIFQERQGQSDPDLVALDEYGNLILFELKRSYIDKKSALDDRLFRYHEVWKKFSYNDLNKHYKVYKKNNSVELLSEHKKFFGLNLSKSDFNCAQKLIGVANVVSDDLIDYIESLNKRGDYTVDFIPYRFYKIGNELFIEFSPKPFDDDFVARRRHNLICKIANSLNDKMNDSFCSLHELNGKYFDTNNLDFFRWVKWNGQGRHIMNFRRYYNVLKDLCLKGDFSLIVDDKSFHIFIRIRGNQDSINSIISCSEAAKYIPALNDPKFKRMTDSNGDEFFRYDLPISSKYSTIDFVKMNNEARSLFDKKNFDTLIDCIMTEIKKFLNLLESTQPFTDSNTKFTIPPTPFKLVDDFRMINDLFNQLGKSTNNKTTIKSEILTLLSKIQESAQQNQDVDKMKRVGEYYGRIHKHDEASRCYSLAEKFKIHSPDN